MSRRRCVLNSFFLFKRPKYVPPAAHQSNSVNRLYQGHGPNSQGRGHGLKGQVNVGANHVVASQGSGQHGHYDDRYRGMGGESVPKLIVEEKEQEILAKEETISVCIFKNWIYSVNSYLKPFSIVFFSADFRGESASSEPPAPLKRHSNRRPSKSSWGTQNETTYCQEVTPPRSSQRIRRFILNPILRTDIAHTARDCVTFIMIR